MWTLITRSRSEPHTQYLLIEKPYTSKHLVNDKGDNLEEGGGGQHFLSSLANIVSKMLVHLCLLIRRKVFSYLQGILVLSLTRK